MNILGCPVIEQVETEIGQAYPFVDMPMMSDEHWQQKARENAVHNFIRENGRNPESEEEACEWQREWIYSSMRENSGHCDIATAAKKEKD